MTNQERRYEPCDLCGRPPVHGKSEEMGYMLTCECAMVSAEDDETLKQRWERLQRVHVPFEKIHRKHKPEPDVETWHMGSREVRVARMTITSKGRSYYQIQVRTNEGTGSEEKWTPWVLLGETTNRKKIAQLVRRVARGRTR